MGSLCLGGDKDQNKGQESKDDGSKMEKSGPLTLFNCRIN